MVWTEEEEGKDISSVILLVWSLLTVNIRSIRFTKYIVIYTDCSFFVIIVYIISKFIIKTSTLPSSHYNHYNQIISEIMQEISNFLSVMKTSKFVYLITLLANESSSPCIKIISQYVCRRLISFIYNTLYQYCNSFFSTNRYQIFVTYS